MKYFIIAENKRESHNVNTLVFHDDIPVLIHARNVRLLAKWSVSDDIQNR